MIGILHGYLLEGSGSNLWTRAVIRSLCRQGETLHLICQENHPDIYDFIAEAYLYRKDGRVETLLQRDVPYPGRCILHKPELGELLPVYVKDNYEEFDRVVPLTELDTAEIEDYIACNLIVVRRIVQQSGICRLHVNHTVLMSTVAQRLNTEIGIPYAVMPHGSALEYAVKRDRRIYAYARAALQQAAKIFVASPEIKTRVLDIFAETPEIEEKMTGLRLGVDTDLFLPVDRENRRENISLLLTSVKDKPRGKTPKSRRAMEAKLTGEMDRTAFMEQLDRARDYELKRPDEDLEEKLNAIDWEKDSVLLYVGRLISGKGVQSLIAALPLILASRLHTTLLLVGHGPLREVLEALIWALQGGQRELVERIIAWGTALEGAEPHSFETLSYFFDDLERNDRREEYFAHASRLLQSRRVVFTGYLTHQELRYLFPCCDLALFPSIVKEAGPLVFLEALSCGSYPMGTYFSGIAVNIDAVAPYLPEKTSEWMKIRPEPRQTVPDIIAKVPSAARAAAGCKTHLRRAAVEQFDWRRIACRWAQELRTMPEEDTACPPEGDILL